MSKPIDSLIERITQSREAAFSRHMDLSVRFSEPADVLGLLIRGSTGGGVDDVGNDSRAILFVIQRLLEAAIADYDGLFAEIGALSEEVIVCLKESGVAAAMAMAEPAEVPQDPGEPTEERPTEPVSLRGINEDIQNTFDTACAMLDMLANRLDLAAEDIPESIEVLSVTRRLVFNAINLLGSFPIVAERGGSERAGCLDGGAGHG